MHDSYPIGQPCEFIETTPTGNPNISKCSIKVCYVQDEPNRNGTVITENTARKMAQSLPGNPIVGCYMKNIEDFGEHEREVVIKNKTVEVNDLTVPYGFVDINPKVWFQFFQDDDGVQRKYLCTEGYIWTGVYPESERIISRGNNQSMELDNNFLQGYWSKSNKDYMQFFIINEAVIKKLCILGEEEEPCFEGAQIRSTFSIDEFRNTMYAMADELKTLLNKGGTNSMSAENVNIQDSTMIGLEPQEDSQVVEEQVQDTPQVEEGQTTEDNGSEVSEPAPDSTFKKSEEEEKVKDDNSEATDGENNDSEPEDDKKKKYSLSEIPEYVEIESKYSALSSEHETLKTNYSKLEEEVVQLREFKKQSELAEKEKMITEKFYMLTEQDTKAVREHINEYSLDDIEKELSVICVRNKVNFALENEPQQAMQFSAFDDEGTEVPEWIAAVRETAKNL